MDSASLNATFPLTFDAVYNVSNLLKFPINEHVPDVRLALDSAAGAHLQIQACLLGQMASMPSPDLPSILTPEMATPALQALRLARMLNA